MAEEWVYASGEPYEGPPPPNNNNNLQRYANLYGEPNVAAQPPPLAPAVPAAPPPEPEPEEPSPHLLVEEGSIQPLSDFTNQLRIREAFFEATDFYEGADSVWHFIEFDLTAAQTRYAFNRDATRGGQLVLRDDFVNCLAGKHIYPVDEVFTGDIVNDDLYVTLPQPIPFPWLQRMVTAGGALQLHLFLYDFDNTPSGYNAEYNTNWYGDDEHWHMYVMFVQDSATTAKMYLAWQEQGEFAVPDWHIFRFFSDVQVDLEYCLRPAFYVHNINRIGQLAEAFTRRRQAAALSGRRAVNNRQLPANVVREIMRGVGPQVRARKTRKRRRNNRKARKSRRSNKVNK